MADTKTLSTWVSWTLRGGTTSVLPLDETSASALEPVRLEPDETSTQRESLRLPSTPAEFVHLYASLEPIFAAKEGPYVLGVSSAVPGEGKTTVAVHLALTLARDTYKRVCLIDLGMNGDTIAGLLGVRPPDPPILGGGIDERSCGIVPIVEGAGESIPSLRVGAGDGLVVFPAGGSPTNPHKLARSPRISQLIDSIRNTFDIAIVDLPAVSTDNVLPLTRRMDGVLIVTRAGATPAETVANSVEAIGRDRVAGVVLNRVSSAMPTWLQRRFSGQ